METNYRKYRAQWQLYAFLAFIFGINIILFITRACYFRGMYMLSGFKPNVFYMLSRANGKFPVYWRQPDIETNSLHSKYQEVISPLCNTFISYLGIGRCLNFSTMMVIIVVLRYSISRCRNVGLSVILPLDHNIRIHKAIGFTIFVAAWIHTICHICNFGK